MKVYSVLDCNFGDLDSFKILAIKIVKITKYKSNNLKKKLAKTRWEIWRFSCLLYYYFFGSMLFGWYVESFPTLPSFEYNWIRDAIVTNS